MGELGGGEGAQIVGDWWMEGGMGVVDISETAVVHIGETALPGPGWSSRRKSGENVQGVGTMPRHMKGIHA